MIKQLLITLIISAFCSATSAQVPPYHITALDSTSTGYYFLMPALIHPGPVISHNQIILDRSGELIYYRPFIQAQTPDFKVQPNGLISYFRGTQFYFEDSTFREVDSVKTVNYAIDTHDMQVLPNGHILLLGIEVSMRDLSMYNWFSNNGSPGSSNAQLRSCVIQELDSARNVVFEWHSKDHFAFSDVDEHWLYSPTVVDWTHSNAIELDDDGNILLSSRHFNEITKINRSDSSIMWRMGGKQNQFTFLNDSIRFTGQHDIRRISNGHVTLFDNGWESTTGTPHFTRGLEYELDEVAKTANLTWSYVYDSTMYSKATGSVQRLPNGNTLINYGQVASNNVTFSVVDSLGSKAFEIAFDDTLFSYRAFNYQSLPWSFHFGQISCVDSAGTYYLDAGAGYNTRLWSTGDTSRFIPVLQADTYYVFLPYGGGGFLRSEKLIVTDVADPCGLLSTRFTEETNGTKVYPNPAQKMLTIYASQGSESETEISIYNVMGERLITRKVLKLKEETIDISTLNAGIYFLKIKMAGHVTTQKIVRQ